MDASVVRKFDASRYDLKLRLSSPIPDADFDMVLGAQSLVTAFERWGEETAYPLFGSGVEDSGFDLVSVPGSTQLQYPPPLVEGRWLGPKDSDEIVVNQRVAAAIPGFVLGKKLTLIVRGETTSWTIVGVAQEMMAMPTAYVGKERLDARMGTVGLSRVAVIRATARDEGTVARLDDAVEAAFAARGVLVTESIPLLEFREAIRAHLLIIATFLSLMALLVVIVGVLGLSSAVSLNVLERTREFGVLMAIGAGKRAVIGIVASEALAVGALSWLVAIFASWPVSAFLADRFGKIFFGAPLSASFSPSGCILWLAIVLACSLVAGYVPASRAAALPIREALAWE
jgi:putative ABC transport system permease protein